MKILLIGGPGNISRGTVDALLARGDEAFILARQIGEKSARYPDVQFIEGDRNDVDAMRHALELSGAEHVLDTVCFEPKQAEQLYEALKGRIRQLIVYSTVDVCGYPLSRLPMGERDPAVPATPGYAQNKVLMERALMDRYEQEGFPVCIGRPSLSIGPDFCPMMFVDWGFQAVPRIRAGMPLLIPGDGNGLMHVGWGYDVGRMTASMLGDEKTAGKTYTLSAPEAILRDDYVSLFEQVIGKKADRVHVPADYLAAFPGVAEIGSIPHLYRYDMAFSMIAFRTDFPDYQWRPLRDGVEEFIRENDRRKRFPTPAQGTLEDRIIRTWRGWEEVTGRFIR